MASLLSTPLSPILTPPFSPNAQRIPSPLNLKSLISKKIPKKSFRFALAESSDSPKSINDDDDDDITLLLQSLSVIILYRSLKFSICWGFRFLFVGLIGAGKLRSSFGLLCKASERSPTRCKMLNDAAFDLANGPVMDECGQELGEMLLNLSRAWEKADTSTSNSIARQLPSLQSSFKGNAKSAFGRRLISAGRRFESMGQYGQGELQKIAKAMAKVGKVLSRGPTIETDENPKEETRMFKFGELQVELTPVKANIGAVIAVIFGFLSWELSQGIQSIPESSLQYANDNALLLAKSLRGALLVLGYSSTFLSASASVGLLLLGRQLSSKSK